MRSALYTGTLMHARRTPTRNVFRYPVSYWLLDLDELPELERRLALVSRQPAATSSPSATPTTSTAAPVKEAVLDFAGDPSIERVLMLTQLRVLGYVFNPVSFYWCYRADGELACMVAEVEQHVRRAAARAAATAPRCATSTTSACTSRRSSASTRPTSTRSREPGDEVWARIHVRDEAGGTPLTAVLHGRRRELTNASLARDARSATRCSPLQVTALIHWQALRLWLKRVPFHHKPPFVPGEGSVRT